MESMQRGVDETDRQARDVLVKHKEIKKQKTREEMEKIRNWNMPKIEDFKCKSNLSLEYFTMKFETKWKKIENEIPKIIELKGLSRLELASSLVKYLEEKKQEFNIFWFEASNKIHFYRQLFEMGESEKIFTETDEKFGTFEEILIGKMKNEILNKYKWVFILNNYNDTINIKKLVHHKEITCVIIKGEKQMPSEDQKIKKIGKKRETKDILKIHEINFKFWQKILFKSENVTSQHTMILSEINKPETAIIVPKSFIGILKGFCDLKCSKNDDSEIVCQSCQIFKTCNLMKEEQKKIENYLKSFKPAWKNDYWIEDQEILNGVCLNLYIRNMSVKWIEKVLVENFTSFDNKFLSFVEILINLFMAHEHDDQIILKNLASKLVNIQLNILPKTSIIVPKSFVEILEGFCKLDCSRNYSGDLILHSCKEFKPCEHTLEHKEKIENFLKSFQKIGAVSEYYYIENQNILNKILDEICSDRITRNISGKWIETVLDDNCAKFKKEYLAFIEILIMSFIAHDKSIGLEHYLKGFKTVDEKLQFSQVSETIIFNSFVQILQDFCELQCLQNDDIGSTSHLCQIFKTCKEMKDEQKKIQNFLSDFVYNPESNKYFIYHNQESLERIFSHEYTRDKLANKSFETALERDYGFDLKILAFVKILKKSFMIAQEFDYLKDFLLVLKLVELVGKWFKYFQNKDIIGSYFVRICDQLEFDRLTICQNQEPVGPSLRLYKSWEILLKVGEILTNVNPETGLKISENALEKFYHNSISIKVPAEVIYTLRILKAKCHYKKGDVKNALQFLENMVQYPRKDYLENLKSVINFETSIANLYLLNQNKDIIQKGVKILEKYQELIIKMGKEESLDFGYPNILETLAIYQIEQQCEYDEALHNLEKIKRIQNLCQDSPINIAKTLYFITIVRFKLGIKENLERLEKSEELEKLENFEKSFETLKNVLEIYSLVGIQLPLYTLKFYFDNKNLREGFSSWDSCTSLTEEFTKILNNYNRLKIIIPTFKFDREFKDWKFKINCHNVNETGISNQSDQMEEISESINNRANILLNLFGENSKLIEFHEAEIYQWIGYCHSYQGESTKALGYYEKSKEILEKYKKFDIKLASNYYSLCQVYHLMGEKNLAIIYLKKAYIQFRSCSNLDGMLMLLVKVEEILETDFTEDFRIWLVSDY